MERKKKPVKKSKKLSKLSLACIACGAVLAGLLIVLGVMAYQNANMVYPLVRAEAGLAHLDPDVFLKDSTKRASFEKAVTQEQLSVPGVYDVTVCYNGRVYPSKVEVVDTVAPVAVANAVTSHGEMPAPEQFISQLRDATPVKIAYQSVPDVTAAGVQTVTLLLTDGAGNTTTLEAELTVVLDGAQGGNMHGGSQGGDTTEPDPTEPEVTTSPTEYTGGNPWLNQ